MDNGKTSAKIVVIGAGIIGASIAYNLATRGETDVVVFDKGRAGTGSTAAALGGFRYQFSNELSVKLSKESIRVIDNFKDLTGYDPLVRHDGYVFVASTENSMALLNRSAEMQRRLGAPVELVSERDLSESYPFYKFERIIGGTYCGQDGHASTAAVHQGYVSSAKQLGVEFRENTEVTAIERKGSSVAGVKTAVGSLLSAGKVVIAAGAFSRLVGNLASVDIPVDPLPRRVLITRPFEDGIPSAIPLIIDVDSSLAVGREGKGILMGDEQKTSPSFELVFPPDHDEILTSRAIKRIPALANASISYANQGLYEMTPDANPIVSAVPTVEGLYCCAGFSGHGFMHSPAIGALMSELLLGKKPHIDISSFDIQRFGEGSLHEREGLVI